MIRISQAGSCPRRLILEAKGIEGEPQWEGSERAFAEGHLHEPSILAWARENLPGAPYRPVVTQLEVQPTSWLRGHIDELASNGYALVLLEAKCLSKRGFQELRYKGVREAHPQYWSQVQLYLAGLKQQGFQVAFAYLVARNKETPKTRMWDHHFEAIEYDHVFAMSEIARLKELHDLIESGGDIEPPYHPETEWKCRRPWCSYTSICHPDWEPEAKTAQDRSDLTDKVELYLEAEEEIKALEELRNEIRAQLLAELAVGEYKAGSHVVKVAERRQERLDTKLARSLIPTDLLPQVIKVTTYKTLNIA